MRMGVCSDFGARVYRAGGLLTAKKRARRIMSPCAMGLGARQACATIPP